MMGDSLEQQMLVEARAEVSQADQKASILLAALGIGFGVILAAQLERKWDAVTYLSPTGASLWWIGAVSAGLSVAAAALAIWPRFTGKDVRKGVTYWGHVATFRNVQALSVALDGQAIQTRARTRHQLLRLAKLVRLKYSLVRVALALAALAGALLAVAAIVVR